MVIRAESAWQQARKYLLLWCIGFFLRLGPLIVPPLIPRLEAEAGFSSSQSALATSLPMLLIGIGALAGGWLVRQFGVLGTLLAGLVVMAAGSALRSLPLSISFFMLVTLLMGIGIALMQTGLPALTRAWLPDNLGRAAAVYTSGLLFGEWVGAGFTGPLATLLLGEHWRLAFSAWMLPIPLLMIAVWVFGDRRQVKRLEGEQPPASALPPWDDPMLWRIALIMASSGVLYFAGNIFLPPILAESGRIHLLDATLSSLNGVQILVAFALIFHADKLVGKHWPFRVLITAALLTIPGMLYAPGFWIVVVAGVSGALTSAILILALALPAWAVPYHQVSRMSAGMLCIGYALVFLVPVAGGWLTDLTGVRALSFLPTLIASIAALGVLSGIRRHES